MIVSVAGQGQRVTSEDVESVTVDLGNDMQIVVEDDNSLHEIRVLLLRPDSTAECIWSIVDEEQQ